MQQVSPGAPFWVAVTLTPGSKRHSLWTNPGDTWATNKLDWRLPTGFTAEPALYPVPSRLQGDFGVQYGYAGPATLLVRIIPPTDYTGTTISISLSAKWGVCQTGCSERLDTATLTLPVGEPLKDPNKSDLFSKTRTALPEISFWRAQYTLMDGRMDALTISLDAGEQALIENAYFFPAEGGLVTTTAPQLLVKSDEGLTLQLRRSEDATRTAKTATGVLMLQHADGSKLAYLLDDVAYTPEASDAPAQDSSPAGISASFPLWQALLLALGGGLILNLMPCVFPILSLKALALASSGGLSPSVRRLEGWSYTAGVVLSFAAIAGVLLLLRSGGEIIGWGFQLQSIGFVSFLAVIMVLVGLSLTGLYDISFGAEATGSGLASAGGSKGAFFTGVLATLVATPCTAPLMAPALGFALAQSSATAILIFLTLGFGMALPFLLLAYSPKVGRYLPRPGAWMIKVKQALAFPMFLTAAWLVFVVSQQGGSYDGFLLLGGLVLISFGVWLWQQGRSAVLRSVSVAIMLGTAFTLFYRPTPSDEEISQQAVVEGEAFSEKRLSELRQDGERVFVYFTADWCITCKLNEQVALNRSETVAFVKENNIHILKGDWTNQNGEIAAVLSRYGRAGVPLYLYFPKNSEKAVLLPEVLTVDILLDGMRQANAAEADAG